jgi:hypothetical protein
MASIEISLTLSNLLRLLSGASSALGRSLTLYLLLRYLKNSLILFWITKMKVNSNSDKVLNFVLFLTIILTKITELLRG